jgi:hypothetical protein
LQVSDHDLKSERVAALLTPSVGDYAARALLAASRPKRLLPRDGGGMIQRN